MTNSTDCGPFVRDGHVTTLSNVCLYVFTSMPFKKLQQNTFDR